VAALSGSIFFRVFRVFRGFPPSPASWRLAATWDGSCREPAGQLRSIDDEMDPHVVSRAKHQGGRLP
jgi:hypothetical protein